MVEVVRVTLLSGMIMSVLTVVQGARAQDCILLGKVIVNDHQLLSQQEKQRLFEPYLGSCIDRPLIKMLLEQASAYYLERGYITSRPFLKQQNIQDGELEISVFKGTIEEIIETGTGATTNRTKSAFAFQKGEVLNLRALETSLEMINRPSSVEAQFKIYPGERNGGSRVEVAIQESSPRQLQLGMTVQERIDDDNTDLTVVASYDNPFNLNDILTLRLNGSQVQEAYQGNRGGELNYSFPISDYLTEIVYSEFFYRQGVDGFNDTYLSNGETQGYRIRTSKMLTRNRRHKLKLAGSIYHKNTKNYFSGQLVDVSSYRTTLAQLDLIHTYLQQWGQLTSVYSYYRGTDWLGARDDDYYAATTGNTETATLQFNKQSIELALLYYLSKPGWQWFSNLHLQFANDLLYDNDKLSVGSNYTVRGYHSQNLYGNNAWYIRNDITKTWRFGTATSLIQNLSMSFGLDAGKVRCESDNGGSCGDASGVAIGLSGQGKELNVSFQWSKPLERISDTFKLENRVKLDLAWRF